MPSEEMLRKLLDEFVEKEALITEELNVVVYEIEQLEEKLLGCKDRLSTIGADRQKVLDMKNKYAAGDFAVSAMPLPVAVPVVAQSEPVLAVLPPPVVLPVPSTAEPQSIVSDIHYPIIDKPAEQNAGEPEPTVAVSDPAALPTQDNAASGDKVVDLGAAPTAQEETDSDTVKSINDALRSLFR